MKNKRILYFVFIIFGYLALLISAQGFFKAIGVAADICLDIDCLGVYKYILGIPFIKVYIVPILATASVLSFIIARKYQKTTIAFVGLSASIIWLAIIMLGLGFLWIGQFFLPQI